jgi:hypothetical protein
MGWAIAAIVAYLLYQSGALTNLMNTVNPTAAQTAITPTTTVTTPSASVPAPSPIQQSPIQAVGTAASSMTGSSGTPGNTLNAPGSSGTVANIPVDVVASPKNNISQRVNLF